MTTYRHLAALGSSFAAGVGITPVVDRRAGRSSRNYPHLLAARLGARLTDLSVGGATTATLVRDSQRVGLLRHTFPPQVAGVTPDVDLVTITAGGNDLGYIAAMMRHALGTRLQSSWVAPIGRMLTSQPVPVLTESDIDRCADGLAEVVEALRLRAPAARIVLVDYLPLCGPATRPSAEVPLSPEAIGAFEAMGEALTEAFARAAQRTAADFVPVAARARDHVLGSATPWVTGFRLKVSSSFVPFHPNAAGMEAVAEMVHDLLTAPDHPVEGV